jgi:hypothetical protein
MTSMMTHLLSTSTFLEGKDFISVFEQSDPDHYRLLAEIPWALGARTAGMRRGSARRAVAVFISLFRRDPGTTAQKFGSFRRRSDLQYRGIPGCNLFAD